MTGPRAPRLVLVGVGHAHAIALERWAAGPADHVDLLVVTDREESFYSGMVPGLVAAEYERHECVIDAGHLARRAHARLVVRTVTAIDADARRILLEGGGSIGYDLASLDVGATVRGLGVPGARTRAATARRPIELTRRIDELRTSPSPVSAVVVGGGAAGVELAATVRARLGGPVTLIERSDRLLPHHSESVSSRAHRALAARDVTIRLGSAVAEVEAGSVRLGTRERLRADLTVWATGPAAHPFLSESGLPVDAEGFVEVDPDLRVVGHPDLFAAGDCASLRGADAPKAGVHAVRQGPVLFDNLLAASRARPSARAAGPRRYEPQRDFLTLLNLGDGTALGAKWGIAVEGRWVRWVKDRIDRRFVERFHG